MNTYQLTNFQKSAEGAVGALLREHGRTVEQRDVLQGTVPFFSSEPQTAVRLRSGDLEVLLFDDEASYSIGGRRAGFERADFGSTGELLAAMLEQLRASALTAPKASEKKRPK